MGLLTGSLDRRNFFGDTNQNMQKILREKKTAAAGLYRIHDANGFAGEVLENSEDARYTAVGEIISLTNASNPMIALHPRGNPLSTQACSVNAFCLDHAGVEWVDANLAGPNSLASTPVMASTAALVAA